MPGYNTQFELTVHDMELIEDALRNEQQNLNDQVLPDETVTADEHTPCPDATERLRSIDELLGRIHNQKVFFRPQNAVYVGG